MRLPAGGTRSRALLAFLAACAGCGETAGPERRDWGFGEEDAAEVEVGESPGGFAVRFVTPAPGSKPLLKGTVEFAIQVDDPEQAEVKFVLETAGTPVVKLVEQEVGPAAYLVTAAVDTTKLPDGAGKLRARVQSGLRKAATTLEVVVDNEGPILSVRAPAEGMAVLGWLQLDLGATDAATRVRAIEVWRDAELLASVVPDEPKTSLDLKRKLDASGWYGAFALTLVAEDESGNRTTREHPLRFTRPPRLIAPAEYTLPKLSLPSGEVQSVAAAIAGIRLGPASAHRAGLVAVSDKGIRIFAQGDLTQNELLIPVADPATFRVDLASVADVDGDGLDDIVAWAPAGWGAGVPNFDRIEVFLQRPAATPGEFPGFAQQKDPVKSPPYVRSMALGRLDGDPYPDLGLVMTDKENTVALGLTGGEPNYRNLDVFTGAQAVEVIAIGRFTQNRPGVLVARQNTELVTVFPVTADGQVTIGVDSRMTGLTRITAAASLDLGPKGPEDHHLALITDATATCPIGTVTAARAGIPGAVLDQLTTVGGGNTGVNPTKVAVGDIDNDGAEDAVVLSTGSNLASVHWGDAEGGGIRAGPWLLAGPSKDVTLFDWDGDGDLDIATLDPTGTVIRLLAFDDAARDFHTGRMTMVGQVAKALVAGRYAGPRPAPRDRHLDALVLQANARNETFVELYSSDPDTGLPILPKATLLTPPGVAPITGLLRTRLPPKSADPMELHDVVFPAQSPRKSFPKEEPPPPTLGFNRTWPGADPEGTNQTTTSFHAGWQPYLAGVSDYDLYAHNDVPDLAVVHMVYPDSGPPFPMLDVWLGSYDAAEDQLTYGKSSREGFGFNPNEVPSYLVSAVLREPMSKQAGGLPDVLVTVPSTGVLQFFPGDGNGGFDYGQQKLFAAGQGARAAAVGFLDVAVDGSATEAERRSHMPDVVTALDTGIAISFSVDGADQDGGVGRPDYLPPIKVPTKLPQAQVALGDVNGDGFQDIVTTCNVDATVSIFVNLGLRLFSDPFVYRIGVGPVALVVDDVNGDGCADVMTADSNGHTLTILKSLLDCKLP